MAWRSLKPYSYRYFAAQQALVITGPTLTNVNDIRAILIAPDNA